MTDVSATAGKDAAAAAHAHDEAVGRRARARRSGIRVRPIGINVAPGADDDGWITPPPVRLADGTLAQLYKDGEALHAAYRAIAAARTSVLLEVYIFHADATGQAFANLLCDRAAAGIEVRVIYDALGSMGDHAAMLDAMRKAGVRLRAFHPLAPWDAEHGWRPFNRDHRKLLVVDGATAVLGGQNLGDEYGSSWVTGKPHNDEWRDTGAGLQGPSVRLLTAAFERMWDYVVHGGPIGRAEVIHSTESFRDDPGGGLLKDEPRAQSASRQTLTAARSPLDIAEDSIAVLASVPTPRSRLLPSIRKLLRDATRSIEMTMAYFAPPEPLIERLCRSARDGVRVRLVLPERSDVPVLCAAARAFYGRLMCAGVEVYERCGAILHAKTLCVDERLSIIGSTNLDYRSIQYNCELSVVIHSRPFGAQMHALFEHDVCFARRIPPDEWRKRPLRDRLAQWAVMRARYLL
jgi:cardiolipin synthase